MRSCDSEPSVPKSTLSEPVTGRRGAARVTGAAEIAFRKAASFSVTAVTPPGIGDGLAFHRPARSKPPPVSSPVSSARRAPEAERTNGRITEIRAARRACCTAGCGQNGLIGGDRKCLRELLACQRAIGAHVECEIGERLAHRVEHWIDSHRRLIVEEDDRAFHRP